MNASERQIWNAAYAACFVARFDEDRNRSGWDSAVENVSAEEAWRYADMSVQEYRRWIRKERDGLGPTPMDYDET